MPSLQPWSKRYLRTGRSKGEDIYILEKTSLRGVWACMGPKMTVPSVNLAGNGVSIAARSG
eukprot:15441292-Alexandrium_andersonii.AAC.1